MVLIIKKGASLMELKEIEKKLSLYKTGFHSEKYNGILKFKEDALIIQNKLRDEWERDFSRH